MKVNRIFVFPNEQYLTNNSVILKCSVENFIFNTFCFLRVSEIQMKKNLYKTNL